MTAKRRYVCVERRNALSSELLLRRLREHHGPLRLPAPVVYPMPAVIVPNPLVENYKRKMASNVDLCRTSFGRVTVAVCEEFGIRRDILLGKKKTADIVLPRHVAMHLMAAIYETSEHRIGSLFKRDHTCVRLAKRKVATMPPHLASRVLKLESALRSTHNS